MELLDAGAILDDTAEVISFFGELLIVRMPGERTGRAFTLVEHVCRRGQAPPWHRHLHDDDTIQILEGDVTVWAGDPTTPILRGGPGDTVFLPRGVPHAFRVESDTARFLGIGTPAGHERFYRDGGEPWEGRALPPVTEPDMDRLVAVCLAHGIELLGPPPALGVDRIL
jgi:quercetin dioxygenase-like cupin family protein